MGGPKTCTTAGKPQPTRTLPLWFVAPTSGEVVIGEANVRGALEQFLSMNLPITMTVRNVFQTGTNVDVATYDDEFGWRYVIDHPFGIV